MTSGQRTAGTRTGAVVTTLLEQRPDQLKVTPGKMAYELQSKIHWDKGRAVSYLLEALGLDAPDVVPLYLGDDVTDEDAFGGAARTRRGHHCR